MSKLDLWCEKLSEGQKSADADALSIPCCETSDPQRLCRHPLVSVRLVTYNHEPYIRECIESVLAQRTDFEFEIVIGEDCSQDRTREICLEYQKRHPDKIRVLWWHENVNRLGGNQARTQARCRGEYIAMLEGDDYWTDPLKLQKQLDLVRATGSYGCVANYATKGRDGTLRETHYRGNGFLGQEDLARFYPHTSTYVIRREFFEQRSLRFPGIHAWYDVVMLHCLVDMGKVALLADVVSVYRITGAGIATKLSGQQKKILGIRQYLDLYLNGPQGWRRRFGAYALTYIAYFFNRSTPGWTREFTARHVKAFSGIFWTIYARQFYDLRSIRALLRYLRFRLGFTK